MATVMVMPALGNSVESCLIVSWSVKEGDTIAENGILCEVETDKAATEVPSTASGTVLKLLWAEGDDVPVMQPLLVVGEPGEDPAPVLAEVGFGAAQGKALGQTAVAAVSAGTGPGAVVDDRMRTNLPNVWAIGDVTGRSLLAHAAYRMGEVAAANILDAETRQVLDLTDLRQFVFPHPTVSELIREAAWAAKA